MWYVLVVDRSADITWTSISFLVGYGHAFLDSLKVCVHIHLSALRQKQTSRNGTRSESCMRGTHHIRRRAALQHCRQIVHRDHCIYAEACQISEKRPVGHSSASREVQKCDELIDDKPFIGTIVKIAVVHHTLQRVVVDVRIESWRESVNTFCVCVNHLWRGTKSELEANQTDIPLTRAHK